MDTQTYLKLRAQIFELDVQICECQRLLLGLKEERDTLMQQAIDIAANKTEIIGGS